MSLLKCVGTTLNCCFNSEQNRWTIPSVNGNGIYHDSCHQHKHGLPHITTLYRAERANVWMERVRSWVDYYTTQKEQANSHNESNYSPNVLQSCHKPMMYSKSTQLSFDQTIFDNENYLFQCSPHAKKVPRCLKMACVISKFYISWI